MGTELADGDGAEMAGALTCLAEALAAVVRDRIRGKRALVAGRLDHLHHVAGVGIIDGIQTFSETDPVPDDLSLLIDAAASHGRSRSGRYFIDDLFFMLLIKLVVPCQSADILNDFMPYADQRFIVGNQGIILLCLFIFRRAPGSRP